uniref:Uncharacterized protein n=2 Tax=Plectus sambesii TaxID=2011161 RepID=A0A914WTS5_9BILA
MLFRRQSYRLAISNERDVGQIVATDSNDGGRKKGNGRPIGWPLCSRRTVVIHLGDLSLRARNKHVLPLRTGDFYLCVCRIDDDSCKSRESVDDDEDDHTRRPVGVSFALRWFDASRDDFAQIPVNPEQLADWLRSARSATFLSLPSRLGCSFNLTNCLLMDGASGLVERRPLCWTRNGDATLSLVDDEDDDNGVAPGAPDKWEEEAAADLIDMTRRPSASSARQPPVRRQTPERGMSCSSFASSASAIMEADANSKAVQPYSPKDITSVRSDMFAAEFIAFAGVCADSGDSAIVELHPRRAHLLDVFIADDVARALGYLHTVHSSIFGGERLFWRDGLARSVATAAWEHDEVVDARPGHLQEPARSFIHFALPPLGPRMKPVVYRSHSPVEAPLPAQWCCVPLHCLSLSV